MPTEPSIDPTSQDTSSPIASIANCISCGYDLRMISSNRCPECGSDVTKSRSVQSQIPWVYRKSKGYTRTYLATVWRVCWGNKWLTNEMNFPHDWRAARTFAWVTAFLLLLPVLTLVVWSEVGRHLSGFRTISDMVLVEHLNNAPFPVIGVLIATGGVPWYVAMTYPIVGSVIQAIVSVTSILIITSAATYLFGFRVKQHHEHDMKVTRERAVAIGYYACGPLFVVGVCVPVIVALIFVEVWSNKWLTILEAAASSPVAVALVIAVVIWLLFWLYKTTRIFAKVRDVGFIGALGFLAAWLVLMMILLVLVIVVLPWTLGLVALLIDVLIS